VVFPFPSFTGFALPLLSLFPVSLLVLTVFLSVTLLLRDVVVFAVLDLVSAGFCFLPDSTVSSRLVLGGNFSPSVFFDSLIVTVFCGLLLSLSSSSSLAFSSTTTSAVTSSLSSLSAFSSSSAPECGLASVTLHRAVNQSSAYNSEQCTHDILVPVAISTFTCDSKIRVHCKCRHLANRAEACAQIARLLLG